MSDTEQPTQEEQQPQVNKNKKHRKDKRQSYAHALSPPACNDPNPDLPLSASFCHSAWDTDDIDQCVKPFPQLTLSFSFLHLQVSLTPSPLARSLWPPSRFTLSAAYVPCPLATLPSLTPSPLSLYRLQWKIEPFLPSESIAPFTEESSFAILFPKYREQYLRETWGDITKFLDTQGIACTLDLIEGSMTVRTTRKTYDPYAILNARDLVKMLARGVALAQVRLPTLSLFSLLCPSLSSSVSPPFPLLPPPPCLSSPPVLTSKPFVFLGTVL